MLIHFRKIFFWPYKHLYSFKLAIILSSSKKTKSHKKIPFTLVRKIGISVNYKSLYWPLWAYWEGSVNAYRDESGGVSWPTVRASCWSEKQKTRTLLLLPYRRLFISGVFWWFYLFLLSISNWPCKNIYSAYNFGYCRQRLDVTQRALIVHLEATEIQSLSPTALEIQLL